VREHHRAEGAGLAEPRGEVGRRRGVFADFGEEQPGFEQRLDRGEAVVVVERGE
jgi:hypothetical protein